MTDPDPVEVFFQSHTVDYASMFGEKKSGANFQFKKRLDLVVDSIRPTDKRLLDCACGTGEITAAILSRGYFDIAAIVDISSNMLNHTKNLVESVCQNDLTCTYLNESIFKQLPIFAEQHVKFDLILCLGLIAHIGRLDAILKLVKECLVPGEGRILVQSSLTDHLGVKVMRKMTAGRYKQKLGYDISYYSLNDIRQIVEECGFTILNEQRFGLSIPFGDRVFPKGNYYAEDLCQSLVKNRGSELIITLTPKI